MWPGMTPPRLLEGRRDERGIAASELGIALVEAQALLLGAGETVGIGPGAKSSLSPLE